MIYLAYDGSLNSDWISRYAIRFAVHSVHKALTLIHVWDGSVSHDLLGKKTENIEKECRDLGVDLRADIRPLETSVTHSLLRAVPSGSDNVLVSGTRIRSRKQTYLAGTISEKLLRRAPLPVLVLRVVQPGLLGNPRDFLIPLAGHPRGFRAAWAFFRLFLPEVESVHLLRVMPVSSFRFPHLSQEKTRSLREEGIRYLSQVVDEILSGRGAFAFHLDTRIVVSENWAREILMQGSRLKARFILLGATEQPLLRRLVRVGQLERLLAHTPCDMGIYRGL